MKMQEIVEEIKEFDAMLHIIPLNYATVINLINIAEKFKVEHPIVFHKIVTEYMNKLRTKRYTIR